MFRQLPEEYFPRGSREHSMNQKMSYLPEVVVFSEYYHEIYNNEEFVQHESNIGQFMIS